MRRSFTVAQTTIRVKRTRRWGWLRQAVAVLAIAALAALSSRIAPASRAQSLAPSPASTTQGLTLPLAIEIALKTNPLLRATTSGQEMAAAQVEEARASRLPSVQLSETFARSNNSVFVFGSLLEQGRFGPQNFDPRFLNNPDALNNSRAALTFRLPLFDQKQSGTRISQARIGQQQAELEKQLAEQQVRFEVLRAFYGVLVAQARREVADEAVRLAESDVKRIGDMFDTGMVVQSDLLAAEVQLAEFRQQQIQAEGDIVTAKAALNTALGVAIDTPQEIIGLLVEKRFAVESQSELIRVAITNRPEFARSRSRLASSKERVRGARAEYWPRLDLFGNVGVSAGNFSKASSDYTVGVSLTFNLFDVGRAARIRQAVAAEAVAAAEQEQLANQIRFEVVRAYQQYVSARERVSVATRVVGQAKEALRIVQDRYQAGLTTITETLRAETTFVRARLMLLSARYDHYTGYAAVLLATGRLTDAQPFVS
jgi:outer membrane protein